MKLLQVFCLLVIHTRQTTLSEAKSLKKQSLISPRQLPPPMVHTRSLTGRPALGLPDQSPGHPVKFEYKILNYEEFLFSISMSQVL